VDTPIDHHEILARLVAGRSLGEGEADAFFEALLDGGLDDAQIGAAIALIQHRGATVDELVGAARAMRRHVTPVRAALQPGEVLLDTCGTGGAAKTFNISTASALVIASASPAKGSKTAKGVSRVLVAKHGNRSRTGRGSAEVLAALGVNIEASPEIQARCLREVGVCFSFAMRHHPAMRHAAGARRSLGFPTIFNLLGPLTNPAGADHQVLGVYRPGFVPLIAEALARLGATRAAVMHGAGGLDECSTLGPTEVAWVDGGRVTHDAIDPASLGVQPAMIEAIRAKDLDQGVRMIRGVLAGESGLARDIVLLNAGVGLFVARAAGTLEEGIRLAGAGVDSGAAARTLERLVACSGG
jgi:anthranilate phosphoribosyltransferase